MSKQKLEPIYENEKQISGFFKDPQSDIVYFLKSINGRKIKFSTKVKSDQIPKAKRFANSKLEEIFGTKKTHITPLIKDELKKWRAMKDSEMLDHGTYQKIDQAILRIEPFWGSKFPKEIDSDNVSKWLTWMNESFPGQQKFNAIKYMRNFAKYLNQKQHGGVALLPAVPRIFDPEERKIIAERRAKYGRIFTPKEFKKVYVAANETERVLAAFMYTMATRIEETLSLEIGKELIQANGHWIYRWSFGQNKADHTGQHFVHSFAAKHLKGKKSGPLFPQQENPAKSIRPQQIDWDGWRKRANLGWHWSSKTFRHTCLSNLFNDSRNPQALVLKLYRVSLAVALSVYVKPTAQGLAKMRDAIEVEV